MWLALYFYSDSAALESDYDLSLEECKGKTQDPEPWV